MLAEFLIVSTLSYTHIKTLFQILRSHISITLHPNLQYVIPGHFEPLQGPAKAQFVLPLCRASPEKATPGMYLHEGPLKIVYEQVLIGPRGNC